MREIVLDTETTGFHALGGDRLVEIGGVEMINHVPTGASYHVYINPERLVPMEAQRVHGLTDEFLADKPVFAEVVDGFLEFIGDAQLVIHNADFDMSFLNAELGRLGLKPIPMVRATDTLAIARRRFPGAQASLDALCRRFGIDNSGRTLHGALLDAQLLAEVWLEMCGGREPGLAISTSVEITETTITIERVARPPRPHAPTEAELAAHLAFIQGLADPMWLKEG
ncbi:MULTISPECIES: DNA polymerase III subunit epsilon [Inquilinus]|uniref:DNA polymerase III subunit epsilon n=1 Tax=Inquilinus ginsengisoli TaxID=363840 RepID=A0ABU1K1M6_9PROT|nr:DNA polymerase III subunit epsilon [Inquilinus ginsengisoli]MDR6293689.1 DNA polymerase-3 subunit epsilon [Inquilinus ginsengisoli]